jgi:hypothetical protein
MQYLAELIAAVTDNGLYVIIGAIAFLVLVIIGAATRGRSPRAGTTIAIVGVAVPLLAIGGWFGSRGLAEMEMAGRTEVPTYSIEDLLEETPEPGYIEVEGHAQYPFGMLMTYGTVLFGNFSKAYCYPVTRKRKPDDTPLIACTFGRGEGGETEKVSLKGVYGMRRVPEKWRTLFRTESYIDILEGAMILEEGVPRPSRQKGIFLIFIAAVAALAWLALFIWAVTRRSALG